eukprot:1652428-Pyramimonas_sp.AAC.1
MHESREVSYVYSLGHHSLVPLVRTRMLDEGSPPVRNISAIPASTRPSSSGFDQRGASPAARSL